MQLKVRKKFVESEVRTGVLQVVNDPEIDLVGRAPGMGLIITIHDKEKGVGGMINALLPSSQLDPHRANRLPALFIDTGFLLLIKKLRQLGSDETKWTLVVVGGANPFFTDGDSFQMGTENYEALCQLTKTHGLSISKSLVGQSVLCCRLKMSTGTFEIECSGGQLTTL